MRSVATITQPQGTPAALAEALPRSGMRTWVAGTPRALVGDGAQLAGDGALPPHMMIATGMPRSARIPSAPLVTQRDVARIVAVAALAALVAMVMAGLGHWAMETGAPDEPPQPVATPLPMPVPVAPECPVVEPPPPPPHVEPPPPTTPPPLSTEPFVIPSALPPLPGVPGLPPARDR